MVQMPAPGANWFAELIQVLDEFQKVSTGLVLPELASAARAADQPAISRALRAQIWKLRGYREGVLHGSTAENGDATELADATERALKHASRLLLALELDWNIQHVPSPAFAVSCPRCGGAVPLTELSTLTCSKCKRSFAMQLSEVKPADPVQSTIGAAVERIANKVKKRFETAFEAVSWQMTADNACSLKVGRRTYSIVYTMDEKFSLYEEFAASRALYMHAANEAQLVRGLFKLIRSKKAARKRK